MQAALKLARRLTLGLAYRLGLRGRTFTHSLDWWERHYSDGGTSGVGSLGDLAEFKAETINEFLVEMKIRSAIEFGCGDGGQLALVRYERYIGLDVSRTAIRRCAGRFENDSTKSFFLYEPRCFIDRAELFKAEVAVSLDVLFHLVEDDVFELYLRHLFASAQRFVAVYSSDFDAPGPLPGVRHRRWSHRVTALGGWRLVRYIPNPEPYDPQTRRGSHADFFFYARTSDGVT